MQNRAKNEGFGLFLSLVPSIGLILDILIDINDTQVPMVIMLLCGFINYA